MKLNAKNEGKIADAIREDLAKIAEEQTPRLMSALMEQERAGGEPSITLTVNVTVKDRGTAENAVEIQTRFGFVRKVADKDEYIPHVIDLGETLFTKIGSEA